MRAHMAAAARRAGTAGGAVPSRTLVAVILPPSASRRRLEAVFGSDAGFERVRVVRRTAYVDYVDERAAIEGIRAHQGHSFAPGEAGVSLAFHSAGEGSSGGADALTAASRARKERALREQMLASDAYCCSVCKEVVLQLESGHSLEELPRRRLLPTCH